MSKRMSVCTVHFVHCDQDPHTAIVTNGSQCSGISCFVWSMTTLCPEINAFGGKWCLQHVQPKHTPTHNYPPTYTLTFVSHVFTHTQGNRGLKRSHTHTLRTQTNAHLCPAAAFISQRLHWCSESRLQTEQEWEREQINKMQREKKIKGRERKQTRR